MGMGRVLFFFARNAIAERGALCYRQEAPPARCDAPPAALLPLIRVALLNGDRLVEDVVLRRLVPAFAHLEAQLECTALQRLV